MTTNDIEPTPNREQRVLVHFAEVRRRKTKGQWQSLPMVAEWHLMAKADLSLNSRRLRLPFYVIQGTARLPLNVIKKRAR